MNSEDALTRVQAILADDIAERNRLFAGQLRQLKLRLVKENMWSSTVAVNHMEDLATDEFKARQSLILQTWQRVLSTLDFVNRASILSQATQNAAQALATERDYLEKVVTSQPVGGLPNPTGFLGEACSLATKRLQVELGFPETEAKQAQGTAVRRRVFISYAREDIEYARRMSRELENASYEPWLDDKCLMPGQRWEPMIEQAIRESHYFVALISSRSSAKRGYVQKEIRQALDLLEEVPDNDIFLIPARLDQCEPAHNALKGVQWVDLFPKWEVGVERIIRALKSGKQMSRERVEKFGGEAIDQDLLILADKYLDISASDWAERVRLKDAIARKMATIVIGRNISKDLLAAQEHEGLLMALVSAIHTSPNTEDFARISRIPHKVERLHIKYRITMALARIFEQRLALQDDVERAFEILDLFNVDADPSLRHRIYKTRRIIKLALEGLESAA